MAFQCLKKLCYYKCEVQKLLKDVDDLESMYVV